MIMLNIMMLIFYLISMLLMIINFFFSKKKKLDREKLSPFECGFNPFNSSRLPFSIQFYMISIIFLIFDVEIVIFLPMIPSYYLIKLKFWLNLTLYFILILLFGLYIEWKDGALTWLK